MLVVVVVVVVVSVVGGGVLVGSRCHGISVCVFTHISKLANMAHMHDSLPDFEMPTDVEVQVAADALRLLGDPNRIKILWALLQGETSVNCLAELIGASASSVSQHLSKLRLAGLVTVRRQGTFAYYAAADEHVRRLLDEALFHADHAASKIPAGHPHEHPRRAKVDA